jgi:heavy metal sensor kinase
MVRSLRGRWLAWLAALLAAVLGGFGLALYAESRKARFDEVDAELLAAARVLEGSMRPFSGPPADRPLSPPPFKGKDKGKGPPPLPPQEVDRERMIRGLNLPRTFRDRYPDIEVPPYFAVWNSDGHRLKAMGDAPDERPDEPNIEDTYYHYHRPGRHEVVVLGPNRAIILVGRSVERELAQLRSLAWRITLTGLGIFAVGLLGGWWVVGRAIRPIAAMNETAAGITADNWSRRMEVDGAPTELAGLAGAVNTMLDRLEEGFVQQVRFTADASHELRTPLAVMMSHLELAQSQPRSPEEYQQTLATCERAARRMKSLTDGLLTLARVDSGKLELAAESVDLHDIAEEAIALLTRLAEDHHVAVTLNGDAAPAKGDADRLTQVVVNLISNAIHYNKPGGSVTVTTSMKDGSAVMTITDTGVGIAAESLSHVFERFFRADASRARDRGGNGLGLAISKGIVEAHGGRIEVESTPGAGSTFSVSVPGAHDAAPPDGET